MGAAAEPLRPWRSWTPVEWLLTTGLVLYGFFATGSVAGVYIGQGLLLLAAIALAPRIFRERLWWSTPMAVGLVLLAYIALHTLWFTGFTAAAWHAVNRYQELWLAPLLLALMRLAPNRRLYYRALIAGATVLAAIHWVGLVLHNPRLDMFLESRRISAGFGFAVCAFLLLMQARHHPHPWRLRVLAAYLAATVLFAAGGRTGYLVVILLVAVATWQHSPKRWRWAACILLPALILGLASTSALVKKRVHETVDNVQQDGQVNTTSTGIRVHMLMVAGQLLEAHPMLGVGYANYGEAHREVVRRMIGGNAEAYARLPQTWRFTDNPHNEYLMQLLGGGIPALCLYLAWLIITLREARHAGCDKGALMVGLCLAFALGGLFNSLLMDFVEGHLYIGLLAWLMAGMRPRPALASSAA
jgi:O-antigen ligase